MAKRITILLFVLVVALSSLTSCFIVINNTKTDGDDKDPVETNKPIEEFPPKIDVFGKAQKSAEEALKKGFDGVDLKGERVSIVIAEDVEIYIQAEQETSASKALSIQKDLISGKLKCDLYASRISYSTFLIDAQAAHNAGLFYADIVCVPQKTIGYMRSRGMLADLNKLYGDQFTEDYFYSDSKQQASGNGAVYGISGKGAVTPGSYGCVYFNKNLTDRYNITDQIYGCVEDGTWTIDKMLEYKGLFAMEDSAIIPVVSDSGELLVQELFSSSGMKYFNAGVDVRPTVADNGEKLSGFISKLQGLLNDGGLAYGDDMLTRFEENGALFYVGTLENAAIIKGAYGIMPLPKIDQNQERYYTYTNENAKVFAVLTTNNRPEYAPHVLKAINATGELIQVGWARDMLDYAFRDSKSYNVAKIIFENASYDLAYMYGESYQSVADTS